MIIDGNLPKFDLPIDFIADDSITGDILNMYSRFPCQIKAGLFILCTEGTVRATINLLEVEMTLSLFFLIHLSKYMKYLRIPVFALPDFLLSLSLQ